MSTAIGEFSQMDEAVTGHLASLRADLPEELASASCQLSHEYSFVELDCP